MAEPPECPYWKKYYSENRDKVLAKAKARYAAKTIEERRSYYMANRDSILAKQRATYAQQTPEQIQARRIKNAAIKRRSRVAAKKASGPVVFRAVAKAEPLI